VGRRDSVEGGLRSEDERRELLAAEVLFLNAIAVSSRKKKHGRMRGGSLGTLGGYCFASTRVLGLFIIREVENTSTRKRGGSDTV